MRPPSRPSARDVAGCGPILLILALLAAAAVGTGAWYFGYARYTTTPAVLQLSPEDAQQRLEDAGLDVKTGGSEYSETVDAGLVMSTDPSAGKRVLKGTDVTITVSLGRAVAQLPKLTGITEDEAQDRILSANMAFGKSTKALLRDRARGHRHRLRPQGRHVAAVRHDGRPRGLEGPPPDPGRQLGRQERGRTPRRPSRSAG